MIKERIKLRSFDEDLKEDLKDPEFKKGFDEEGLKLEISLDIIQIRKARKMSQADLAKAVGTNQSAIARIENGTMNPTALTLHRIAVALGKKLKVKFD